MKWKTLTFIIISVAVMLCTSCSSVNSLTGRTISEQKVESYLHDSLDAVAYLFAYDPDYADKAELDSDFKVRSSATTYKARAKNIESDDRTYLIPETDMEKEIASVYTDSDITGFENNDFVSQDENGTYHLLNGDWGDAGPVFSITDANYGLNGSEPTEITVHYTFSFGPDEGDMSDKYDYEVHYTLVADKESPYTFKIVDITAKNLIPVKNVKEAIVEEETIPEENEETASETEPENESTAEIEVETRIDMVLQDLPMENIDGKGDVFFSKDEMPYVEIIEKYRKAVDKGWESEEFYKDKISLLFRECKSEDEIGFCLKYMDDSEYPWLFIGTMVGAPFFNNMISDAYSLDEAGNLVQQFSGWERNRYYYIETGEVYPMIANEGFSSAGLSDYYYFDVKDGKLKIREGIIHDEFTDMENPWFYIDGTNNNLSKVDAEREKTADDKSWPDNLNVPRYEASDGVPITKEKAYQVMDAYSSKYRRMDWHSLSEGYEILED